MLTRNIDRTDEPPEQGGVFSAAGGLSSWDGRTRAGRGHVAPHSNVRKHHHERFKLRDNIVSFKSRYINVVFITRLGWAAVGETQCIRAVNL